MKLFLAGLFALAGAANAAEWCDAHPAPTAAIDQLQRAVDRLSTDRPRAIERLHTEGTLPHQGIWDQSIEAKKDLPLMRDLALVWREKNDAEQLAAVAKLLAAWTAIYQPNLNPIDETDFEALIDAFAITGPALPAELRQKLTDKLRPWAQGYIRSIAGPHSDHKGTFTNNWQSHRIKLVTLAAVALDDSGLFASARELFVKQLNDNLRPDGSVADFYERDALHYVTYDLEPLARAAIAARLRDEDWLTLAGPNGASLQKSLDWLLPYAKGETAHQEYVHTTVKFDHDRAAAGVPGFTGMWEPKSSAGLYWLAGVLAPRYRIVAETLMPEPANIAACWR